MRMGQGVRTGLGHGGITCVLQTQFSSFFLWRSNNLYFYEPKESRMSVLALQGGACGIVYY